MIHDVVTLFYFLSVLVDDIPVAGDAIGIDWLTKAINVDEDLHQFTGGFVGYLNYSNLLLELRQKGLYKSSKE
jgi:hypothetical protein